MTTANLTKNSGWAKSRSEVCNCFRDPTNNFHIRQGFGLSTKAHQILLLSEHSCILSWLQPTFRPSFLPCFLPSLGVGFAFILTCIVPLLKLTSFPPDFFLCFNLFFSPSPHSFFLFLFFPFPTFPKGLLFILLFCHFAVILLFSPATCSSKTSDQIFFFLLSFHPSYLPSHLFPRAFVPSNYLPS